MSLSTLKKAILMLLAVVLTTGTTVLAQEEVTLKSATETYNSGAKIINEDPAKALEYFEKCLEMCDELEGDEADDLRLKAERPIANLYYKVGYGQLKEKNYEAAIVNLNKAYDFALLVEDVQTEKKAESTIPRVYLGMGTTALKAKDYDKALENFGKVLELDKRNEKAFYYMASAYTKQGNFEKVFESYDNAIKYDKTGPKKTAKGAKKRATNILLKQGQASYKAKQWEDAIAKFEKSLLYTPNNAQVINLIARSHFANKNYDQAIAKTEELIAMEKGGDVGKAKYYYFLGEIYQKKGNNVKACEMYKQSSFGEFKANADYKIQHELKCK